MDTETIAQPKSRNKEEDAMTTALLSIIIPTFNERSNVEPLIAKVEATMGDTPWELIFVDDNSPDQTSQLVKEIARKDSRIRCIRRVGRRGLSSAASEGILSSAAPFVAVMDGDLQHDETLLPAMLAALLDDKAEIVIGSRYVPGGSAEGLAGSDRHGKSKLGNWLARKVLRVDIADPMSGFFMLKRDIFEEESDRLSAEGFKILLDIMTSSSRPLRALELPMSFRERHSGESKLDLAVEIAFANMILDKTIGRFIPRRFFMFSLVGGIGVFIHLGVLKSILLLGLPFAFAQGAAAITAMTTNFWMNNVLTFADKQLKGGQWLKGLLSFYLVCSVGLIGNIGVADFLFTQNHAWWLSGMAGALVGAVWNYAASSIFTWRK